MKRKLRSFSVALLVLLALVLPARGAELDNVTDAAGILSQSEWESLETRAREISQQYDFGVNIFLADDYRLYADGALYPATEQIYEDYSLGMGPGHDGLLLLLSMADRDFCLLAYGDYAQYAFNEEGQDCLTNYFLDDFGVDAWYDGLTDYLNWSADFLAAAKEGRPYSYDNIPMSDDERSTAISIRVGAILLIPLVIAGIYIMNLSRKMKSVAQAVQASSYISGDLQLTSREDLFSHTTRTERKIESDSDKDSHSSGRSTGTTGKF